MHEKYLLLSLPSISLTRVCVAWNACQQAAILLGFTLALNWGDDSTYAGISTLTYSSLIAVQTLLLVLFSE